MYENESKGMDCLTVFLSGVFFLMFIVLILSVIFDVIL